MTTVCTFFQARHAREGGHPGHACYKLLSSFSSAFVTIQHIRCMIILQHWIPAFAGMTVSGQAFPTLVIPAKAGAIAIQVFFLALLSSYRLLTILHDVLFSMNIFKLIVVFGADEPGVRP
jgi:hypothetical protein